MFERLKSFKINPFAKPKPVAQITTAFELVNAALMAAERLLRDRGDVLAPMAAPLRDYLMRAEEKVDREGLLEALEALHYVTTKARDKHAL